MLGLLLFLIFIILAVVLGWHILFALLGGVIAVSAIIWVMVIISIVIFCIVVLLAFIFTGFIGLGIGVIFTLWTIVTIIFFPLLFPVLLPLFIIYAFITYIRRRQQRLE